jgi:hypothetical protein
LLSSLGDIDQLLSSSNIILLALSNHWDYIDIWLSRRRKYCHLDGSLD